MRTRRRPQALLETGVRPVSTQSRNSAASTLRASDPSSIGAQADGKAALIVNVASKCGLTPQYEGLERLHESYAERGFTSLSVQFGCTGGQHRSVWCAERVARHLDGREGVARVEITHRERERWPATAGLDPVRRAAP